MATITCTASQSQTDTRSRHQEQLRRNSGSSDECKLLSLPPEISNRIYELVLIQTHRLRIERGQTDSKLRALLAACKDIHQQASSIFYGANCFGYECTALDLSQDVRSTTSLIRWLKGIGSKNRRLLQPIHIWRSKAQDFAIQKAFRFLRDQNARLVREGVGLPLTILRFPLRSEHLDLLEVETLAETERMDREEREDFQPVASLGHYYTRTWPTAWGESPEPTLYRGVPFTRFLCDECELPMRLGTEGRQAKDQARRWQCQVCGVTQYSSSGNSEVGGYTYIPWTLGMLWE